ncbi:MAG: hypothetical protein FJY65_06285 [Calditrichaeota bacterium]|nr:hypothetical protein [Calditrichota bacterium]
MKRIRLGIDGGGTSTRCIVVDADMNILSRGEGGPANYRKVGLERVFASLREAVLSAVQAIEQPEIAAVGFGLAGVDKAGDKARILGLIERLKADLPENVVWNCNSHSILITNDAEIALAGGIEENIGIVVVAGTGTIVYGRNAQNETWKVDGWGHLLGDDGSAFDIGKRALRKVTRGCDRRYKPTKLMQLALQHFGISNLGELKEVIYGSESPAEKIASFAVSVDLAASQGNEVARKIINKAALQLAVSTLVLKDVLFIGHTKVKVITSGGVWKSIAGLREMFIYRLNENTKNLVVCEPMNEPAWGAAKLTVNYLNNK